MDKLGLDASWQSETTKFALVNDSELPNTESKITVWASYPTDSGVVDFLRPPLPRLTSGQ
ncbi:MAG: hypothetical protein Kow0091_15780 [Geminocystis sp.]